MSLFNQWRKCAAPGCSRRVKLYYFCCGQHRDLLGLELSQKLQYAWIERTRSPQVFETLKAEALRKWGWQPETLCVGKRPQQS